MAWKNDRKRHKLVRKGIKSSKGFTASEPKCVITDIDRTIAKVGLSATNDIIFKKDPPAIPGSIETLRRLARKNRIVYLTARAEVFRKSTQKWLNEHGFPKGKLLMKPNASMRDNAEYKSEVIEDIKERCKVIMAFGDSDTDEEAYQRTKLKYKMIEDEKRWE